jgi:hypothetical protein
MAIIRDENFPENLCPVCGQKPIMTCRCMEAHSSCANGHNWHTEGKVEKKRGEDGRMYVVKTWHELVLDAPNQKENKND